MPLTRFDHVNIRTAKLEKMTAWYVDILGLKQGPRPDFPFRGAWLYLGDFAVVHLVEIEETPETSDNLGLEHFAFRSTDLEAFLAHLAARDLPHSDVTIDAIGVLQVNINDPDGNHIHIDFDV